MKSDTLKSFVKMHERKLNAKLHGLPAEQLQDELNDSMIDDVAYGPAGAAQHWNLNDADKVSRRRPKSRYFNFILTGSH
jgi:hypothetical protein